MVTFAQSPRSTLGVEWELALVDAQTLDLVPRAGEVLDRLAESPRAKSAVVGEMLTNTVEVVSGVHTRVADAVGDLDETIAELSGVLGAQGLRAMSAGTHPFAKWQNQEVTDKERYAELINRTQWWGRHMLIFGVHTHVGIDSREKVLPILNSLLRYVPHLQAVSASSPFWSATDTHYASNRAMMFQQLPTAGLPFQFSNWSEYEKYVSDMRHTGVIDEINEIRWDIRPSPGWGTIEVRVCDGLPTSAEVAAVTAFVQCVVDDLSERLDHGETLPTMPNWFHVENKWRAARYGMDAIIIENAAAEERLVTEVIADEVARLAPVAQRLGCEAELAAMDDFASIGASYQRQRARFAQTESLTEVARLLVDEFSAGRPLGG
ncbi:glutamate--cysteine ligase [Brevibacterium sp. 5221]|uniref:Putative glutamate--cysteine ligase 2 n=1 Tax=Brevibacterium rongguiense TaxID=2695267 RepID=A0A6N9H3V8_9MICO|nr:MULTISPECIES: glutamate--cysteine ligase [Brevibacterium]MYM18690.1 glutamate--cysteine ligase [Brevibacterium rongguiense]WAL40180.1 glutamate--cysteine ligase [Brevibacterium sp. BRM-1]